MAQLHMVSYKLQDLQFFNKLDKPGQVNLENNFSFSVNYSPDNTRCMAKLYQCVKDKTDGMIPKVGCCIEAIYKGVQQVIIMDGRVPHSILMELLTDEGAGTMVTGDKA